MTMPLEVIPARYTNANDGIISQKILQIQQEILMIRRHKREHITENGQKIAPDESCPMCEVQKNENDKVEWSTGQIKRNHTTLNEMERTVGNSGKNGYVLVPKTWAGKTVKIILLDES